MNVLVACEFSGIVREAFRKRGHNAWSCDLIPAEDGSEFHYEGDVRDILDDRWDLLIAHPPCTYLCSSGLHWNHKRPERAQLTEEALEFVALLLNAPIKRKSIENPVGCISTRIRKPNQTIHPHQFGHPESKTTCLWNENLPDLIPTNILEPPPAWVKCDCCDDYICTLHPKLHVYDCKCPDIDTWASKDINPYITGGRWANQTPSGQNKLGPSDTRWMDRARTYQGIADAMAEQWGGNLEPVW